MNRISAILSTLRDVVGWLRSRRLGWLAPLVFLLLGLGVVFAVAAAAPALSPFVYLLF